jgi:putative glutamine amidotransferase
MSWLISYPENGPSVPYYTGWLGRAGLESALVSSGQDFPADIHRYDGVLLAGGPDIDPLLYGDATVHPETYGVSRDRDDLEFRLIREFRAAHKPIFGICRGIQVINVAFGGKLIQDIPDRLGAQSGERHRAKGTYDTFHPVTLQARTRLGQALRGLESVNSAHHQALRADAVGSGLQVVARTPAGIIEAIETSDPAERIVGVQWHPERLPPDHPATSSLLIHLKYLCALR